MRQTPELLQAVRFLRSNTQFQVFMNWLGDYSEEVMKELVYADETRVRLAQGKAQALTHIINTIDSKTEI